MRTTKQFTAMAFALALTLFLPVAGQAAANMSADDFLPPVQAKTPEAQAAATQVQKPEEVKQVPGLDGKQATTAATTQDAVNAAIKLIPQGGGCEQIKVASGTGWVATGTSIYSLLQNPTANLMAQRAAYQKAFLQAKKNLATALKGLSTEAKTQLVSEMKTNVTGAEALSNTSDTTSESMTESVNAILRGYVIYNVNDKQSQDMGTVTVTIAVTPKTTGEFQRVDPNSLSADSVRDGLSQVLVEINNNLLPPVGGKAISVPATGELAFVGFGSAVVPSNPNAAVRAKLELQSQKIAQMRARSALCGVILGDQVSATSSLDSSTKDMSAQFEELQKEDATADAADQAGIKKLAEQRTDFLNTQTLKEEITSIRKGVLPPGVMVRTYSNEARTQVYAVAVYIPSVTAGAHKAAEQMEKANLVQDWKQNGNGQEAGQTGSAVKPEDEWKMPPQGPSGQVSKDADL